MKVPSFKQAVVVKYDRMRLGSQYQLIRINDSAVFYAVLTKLEQAFPGQRVSEHISRTEHTILLTSDAELMYFKLIINDLI
jgi:hypothetical protein